MVPLSSSEAQGWGKHKMPRRGFTAWIYCNSRCLNLNKPSLFTVYQGLGEALRRGLCGQDPAWAGRQQAGSRSELGVSKLVERGRVCVCARACVRVCVCVCVCVRVRARQAQSSSAYHLCDLRQVNSPQPCSGTSDGACSRGDQTVPGKCLAHSKCSTIVLVKMLLYIIIIVCLSIIKTVGNNESVGSSVHVHAHSHEHM